MDEGVERIEQKWLRDQLRRQARKVQLEALLSAALITILFLLLPF